MQTKRANNKIKEARVFNAVIITILVLYAVSCIFPMVNVISLSFSDPAESIYILPKGLNLKNYGYVITDAEFFRAFGMSILVTVCGTVLSVTITVLAAFAISKECLPFRKGFMILFIISMLFSGGMIPAFIVMKVLGLVDTPLALILPSAAQVYNLILMKNYMMGLPKELEESAQMDGASYIRLLFSVILPVSLPMLATISLFIAVGYWNSYFNAVIYLPTKTQFRTLPVFLANMVEGTGADLNDPYKSLAKSNIEAATIVLAVVPILCVYPTILKHFTKGVVIGSVKG